MRVTIEVIGIVIILFFMATFILGVGSVLFSTVRRFLRGKQSIKNRTKDNI